MYKHVALIVFTIIIFVAGVSSILFLRNRNSPRQACTMEAKQCPDGSYVGRSGPQCQFAECPKVSTVHPTDTGILTGQITLSPICPVERVPPDPACAPKPYAVLIDVLQKNELLFQVHADKDGKYLMTLRVGVYTISPHVDALYPRCDSKEVTVKAGITTTTDISCDTGIR